MSKRKYLILILLALIVALLSVVRLAYAGDEITFENIITEDGTYRVAEDLGEMTVSAYYPGEDGYWVNHKGESLADLVGENVAVPTGHWLLGKWIYIEGVGVRRCWNTGCKPGRIDLLVEDSGAMREWGLRDVQVWLLDDIGEEMTDE